MFDAFACVSMEIERYKGLMAYSVGILFTDAVHIENDQRRH